MRRVVLAVGTLASLGTQGLSAGAQSTASFGVGAGVAVPVGPMRHEVNPGWRAIATLDLVVPDLPATLRFGARFDLTRVTGFAEARMHCVPQDQRDDCLLPVTVGLFFGGAHRDERDRPPPGHSPD